jgi:hypothetical protein
MEALNISLEHIQIVQYAIGAVVGLMVLVGLWNCLKGPIRRKKIAAFACQYNLAFTPRLRFSSAPTAYSHANGIAVSRSDHDPVDPPHKLHIEAISSESVLNDPRFFSVFNTSQIRNYCQGTYRCCPVEIFDWQQSRGRGDRSGKGPRSTLVILRPKAGDLPWFVAVPSVGRHRRKMTNSIQPSTLPEFNTSYRLQAPDGHPNSENRIVSMMSRAALKLLVDSATVRVQAAGPHLVFSHGNVALAVHAIIDLLDFGIEFDHLLDKA